MFFFISTGYLFGSKILPNNMNEIQNIVYTFLPYLNIILDKFLKKEPTQFYKIAMLLNLKKYNTKEMR